MSATILICQHVTCRQQGATDVLAAFQLEASSQFTVQPVGCLGQCGNGPMVLILPEETWYCGVVRSDVPKILKQHLQSGQVVTEKLYPKFHPIPTSHVSHQIGLSVIGIVLVGALILVLLLVNSHSASL
jgi:(2Fe-2S) ferredoxin